MAAGGPAGPGASGCRGPTWTARSYARRGAAARVRPLRCCGSARLRRRPTPSGGVRRPSRAAAALPHARAAAALLAGGADVNAGDCNGYTPAVYGGDVSARATAYVTLAMRGEHPRRLVSCA